MKIKRILSFVVYSTTFVLLNSGSCDKTECNNYWVVNKTIHNIKVDIYCDGEQLKDLSYIINPSDSIMREACGLGSSFNPFITSCINQSYFIKFNDTLVIDIFAYKELYPSIFEKVGENVYRFIISDVHFQKALEVNGYLK